MTASPLTAAENSRKRGNDPVSWYLSSIGRVPLLTPAEEIELGNQVQTMMNLVEQGEDAEFTAREKLIVLAAVQERMMKANLRLVVSVAKKYGAKVWNSWI